MSVSPVYDVCEILLDLSRVGHVAQRGSGGDRRVVHVALAGPRKSKVSGCEWGGGVATKTVQ